MKKKTRIKATAPNAIGKMGKTYNPLEDMSAINAPRYEPE